MGNQPAAHKVNVRREKELHPKDHVRHDAGYYLQRHVNPLQDGPHVPKAPEDA